MSEEEFYNLCQAYRHAPATNQASVIECYEVLKGEYDQLRESLREAVEALQYYESKNNWIGRNVREFVGGETASDAITSILAKWPELK